MVAKKLDQFYTISRLVGIYESNEHQRIIHDLNKAIRHKPLSDIGIEFDQIVVEYFNSKNIPIKDFNDIFQYKYFEKSKHDQRFTKYVLARIDRYLADILSEQSFTKQHTLHFITHSGTQPVNGFHIEHLFANNDKIMAQFKGDNGDFDEKLFNDERNRLGALILLKGNENIRTSNSTFDKKMNSYINSGFVWNRVLTNSINKASLNSCNNSIKDDFKNYLPDTEGLLSKDAIEERQQLIFKIIKIMYENK